MPDSASELQSRIEALARELEEARAEQTATAEVLGVISRSGFSLESMLQALTTSAVHLCSADSGVITLRVGDFLRFMAGHGQSEELYAYERTHPHPIGRGTFQGRAALEGRTIHVADVRQDVEYERPEASVIGNFRTVLCVPLRRSEGVVGVFALGRRKVEPFALRQIKLVETFADQAVIAIENERLFEEVQARNRDVTETLEQQTATSEVLRIIASSPTDVEPVLKNVVESAVRLCEADDAMIMLRDGDSLVFGAHTGPLPADLPQFPIRRDWVSGRAILEGKTIQVDDLATAGDDFASGREMARRMGSRTILSTPLLQEGVAIGVLILRRSRVAPFSDKQIKLVETFADQSVIAIQNVRLFEEVQASSREVTEALRQQTATADVLKVISQSAFDLDSVLQTLIDSACKLCRSNEGGIYMLDNSGGAYRLAAHYGMTPEFAEYEAHHLLRVGRDSYVGRTALERAVVHVPDVSKDLEYGFPESLRLGGFKATLSVPLMREGVPIGVFAMGRLEPGPFTPRQIELVQTFADQAVIAIENVRLFDEVQARNREVTEALEQQTATGAILRVIAASPTDIQPVLQVVAESAARFCDTHDAVIFLAEEGDLIVKAHYGPVPLDFASLPIGDGTLAGRAFAERKTQYVDDLLTGGVEFPQSKALALKYGHRSIAATPLMRDEDAIGVIVIRRFELKTFTEKQIELLRTFADQAVIAIQNVRLFDEVRAKTRDLERSLEDLRTAQDRLIQTEKLASLGQLTAGIAHEIKNPLNFVNNFSSLSTELIGELQEVLERAPLDDSVRAEVFELTGLLEGNLDKVVQHGRRADSIVKNMLLHSREGSSEHRPININTIVEESLNLAYHGARAENKDFTITLQRDLDPAAGEVDLYPQEITRVLLNLISNGFYATTIRKMLSDAAYEPLLTVSTKDLGDHVEIRILDNGTGISPEVQEKMFTPFFTTKPAGKGTGLGLSISHDIVVKQHAGTIDVDTRPGEFTEFRIVLPRGSASLGRRETHRPAFSQPPR